MRIAFLADSLDRQYGGIHVYTKELLHALTEIDRKNEYLIFRSEAKNEFPNAEEVALPYSDLPGHRASRIFYQLPKLVAQKSADIVVEPAHFGPFNLPKKIKRVTVIHDLTMFLFPKDHVFSSQILQRLFLPRILRKADHIITNSENTSQDLHRFFPFTKNKTTAIFLGKSDRFSPILSKNLTASERPVSVSATQLNADRSCAHCQVTEVEKVLKKHKIKHPFLLCTATFEPRKNLPMLVRAFNDFKSKTGMPHQLILVGKNGWKSQPIFDEINRSPFKKDILHLGFVSMEDLPILYRSAEVFVYPSKYEGFGLPVVEAMASGAPVLISSISSLPEVGGSAAEYFAPDSEEGLSQKLTEICSDEKFREELRAKSLAQAAKFSWKKTARETMKVFQKTINPTPKTVK